MNSSLAILVGVALVGVTALSAQSKHTGLEGAWQVAEVRVTGPDARTIAIPEPRPNLIVFTGRHYSRVEIHADGPRPVLADVRRASADELRAAWGPFVGEAGTYEVTGDILTMHPIVARNPEVMAPGGALTYSFKLDGRTFWATFKNDRNGPVANPVTVKAVRIE
jgi:hypothetical protein